MLTFKGKALTVILVAVILSISVSPMIFNNQMQPQSGNKYSSTIFGSLQQYAEEQGMTVEQLTANWTADDWLRWYKYEGNPSWGSTNITDQFLATDWVKLPNSGNLTWGANYDYEYKYNATSDRLEMWHNGTLVSYLDSDDLWHYVSDRPNLTDLHQIVDKQYVDYAVASLGARYYMINTSSGISDYKLTQLSPPSGSEESVTKTGLADDEYVAGWISPDTSLNKLIKGVYNWNIYAEKTGGTQTLRLYWQLVERKSDTTETIIATSVISNEILASKNSYIIPLTLSEDYTLDDGSYVVGKIYADISGGGSAPDIAIYFNGTSKSHWEIPVNLEFFSNQFLKLNGSNANSDIDITPYNLTVGNISAFNLKSPASYIIWKDGSTYYATNGTTGLIDYSGTDATTILRNAIDAIDIGCIVIKSLDNDEYVFNTAVTSKTGVSIISDGAKINISGLNNTFITIGNDTTVLSTNTYTKISGFYVIGDTTNTDTVFIQASNVPKGLVIRDIITDGVNNVLELRGKCYSAEIENVNSKNVGGVWIKLVSLATQYYIPNAVKIINCELTATSSATVGIELSALGSYYTDEVFISNNWIEMYSGVNIQIAGANRVSISNNLIFTEGGTGIEIQTGQNIISNNEFWIKGGKGIDINQAGDKSIISNNVFLGKADVTKLIYASQTVYSKVDGNYFYFDADYENGRAIDGAHGVTSFTVTGIENNVFYNSFGISAGAGNSIISNNMFISNSYPMYDLYIHNCLIAFNYFYSPANDLYLGTNNTFRDNIGYITENSGSSEITGDGTNTSFAISHGLATTPSQVLITPTNSSMASATWWVSAKTSTYFNVTFSTAPSSGTKLSFDWYAEV